MFAKRIFFCSCSTTSKGGSLIMQQTHKTRLSFKYWRKVIIDVDEIFIWLERADNLMWFTFIRKHGVLRVPSHTSDIKISSNYYLYCARVAIIANPSGYHHHILEPSAIFSKLVESQHLPEDVPQWSGYLCISNSV